MRNKDIKRLIDIASDGGEQSVDSEEIKRNLLEKISKNGITWEQSEGKTVKPVFTAASRKERKYSFAKIAAGSAAACFAIGAIGTAAYKNGYGSEQLPTLSSDNVSDTVQYALSESTSDLQPEVSENEPQTFTENFNGIVMTVKTDKSRYQLDELIHVEAAVKNTTDKKIYLFVPVLGPDSHKEISTGIYGNDGRSLIDTDTFMRLYDQAIDIVTVNPNEEYTQSMVFETYTGVDTSSRKLAEEGLYSGKSTITLLSDSTDCSNGDKYTHYSLDFSLTLGSTSNLQPEQPEVSKVEGTYIQNNSPSKNPSDYEISLLDGTVVQYINGDTHFSSGDDDSLYPIVKERDKLFFTSNGEKHDITDQISADRYFCVSYVHPETGLTHYLITGGDLEAGYYGYFELFWLPGDSKRAYVDYKFFTGNFPVIISDDPDNDLLDILPNTDWIDNTLKMISDTLKEEYNISTLIKGSGSIRHYVKFPDET